MATPAQPACAFSYSHNQLYQKITEVSRPQRFFFQESSFTGSAQSIIGKIRQPFVKGPLLHVKALKGDDAGKGRFPVGKLPGEGSDYNTLIAQLVDFAAYTLAVDDFTISYGELLDMHGLIILGPLVDFVEALSELFPEEFVTLFGFLWLPVTNLCVLVNPPGEPS